MMAPKSLCLMVKNIHDNQWTVLIFLVIEIFAIDTFMENAQSIF